MLKKKSLTHAVRLAAGVVALTTLPAAVNAQSESSDAVEMVVTGSLISRQDFDGPSPVVVIDSDAIRDRGFINVTDVMDSLTQSTGAVQGEQYYNSFTPAAQDVNLRGFGAGRTLTLLNGRRLADYPTPYNGQSNFFNFASIPTAAIERIEVLTDGASAIYGSDAIAGVVNIITKQEVEETTITGQVGTTTEGAGDSHRLQLVTGKVFDRGSVTFTAEYQEQDPIFGKDRDYMDSNFDRPVESLRILDRAILTLDNFADGVSSPIYVDPGEQTCIDSNTGFEYAFRPGRGYYCGDDGDGRDALRTYRERTSLYLDGRYDLTDNIEIYSNAMWFESTVEHTGFLLWWTGDILTQEYEDSGYESGYYTLQRFFSPAETGSQNKTFEEDTWNVTLGVRGNFMAANRDFDWMAEYTESRYNYEDRQTRFKEEAIDEWYMGTTDLYGYGILSGSENSINDFLDPSDIAQLTGVQMEDDESYSKQLRFQLNTQLFDLEWMAGPTEIALVAEFAEQGYQLNLDDRTVNFDGMGWWGLTGTGGGGDRERSAYGFEVLLPLTDQLEVTLASRLDKYDDISDVDGKVVSQAKFSYRPSEYVMVRGGWAESFRAPDMHYMFAGESGYFTTVEDTYRCLTDPDYLTDEGDCPETSEQGIRSGQVGLKEESGENYHFGFVLDPIDGLSISLDWFSIELKDVVFDASNQQLLDDEADCRTGVVDASSDFCQSTVARIIREVNPINGEEEIDYISGGPINQAFLEQKGIDLHARYYLDTDNRGSFTLDLGITNVLDYKERIYEGDPVDDIRNAYDNYEPRSIVNGSITWDYDKFSTTLYGKRTGTLPNWAEDGRIDAWTTYNLNANYQVTDNLGVGLTVVNLTNERPPEDPTFDTWPYFYRGQYNAFGREVFLEGTYRF